MKKAVQFILIILLTSFNSSFCQDVIIKTNGDEIEAKVLEVGLKIVRYTKFSNPNGPTYEILKSDIFMIKYENGTKDLINPVENKKKDPRVTIRNTDRSKEDNALLAFTEKHRSTSIGYGVSGLFGGITSFDGTQSSMVIGPIMLSFDQALSEKFSIAFRPAAMYYKSKTYYNGYGRSKSNLFFGGIQARVDFHFATSQKLDPYFGLGGGAGYFFAGSDGANLMGFHPIYGGGFGIKYYGNSKNALLIELGYDSYSFFKVGYTLGRIK